MEPVRGLNQKRRSVPGPETEMPITVLLVYGTRDHVTSKVGYAVTLRHVRCAFGIWPSHQKNDRVLAWAGLDVQRDTSPPSAALALFTFMMRLAPVTNWEPPGVTLAGNCYVMRHGMKVQIVTVYCVSCNVTALRYVVKLQCVCPALRMSSRCCAAVSFCWGSKKCVLNLTLSEQIFCCMMSGLSSWSRR
jgi:hypothetical protein